MIQYGGSKKSHFSRKLKTNFVISITDSGGVFGLFVGDCFVFSFFFRTGKYKFFFKAIKGEYGFLMRSSV